jgi:hypothetical protein
MARDIYHYVYKGPYSRITEIISGYDLPNSDTSQMISGFLSNSNLDEQDLKRLNNAIAHEVGLYGKNEIVIDSGATQGTETETAYLGENGYYYIRVLSAGGRGKHENRFAGNWVIIDNYNIPLDTVTIYPQNDVSHKITRSGSIDDSISGLITSNTVSGVVTGKEVSGTINNGFVSCAYISGIWSGSINGTITDKHIVGIFKEEAIYTWERTKGNQAENNLQVWKGNYTYLNNTVFLSLEEYTYNDIVINNKSIDKENYGILMFREDEEETGLNKYKLFPYRNDDSADDFDIKYSFSRLNSSLYNNLSTYPDSNYNILDAKGGDGQFYNKIACLNMGNIGYYIGKALSTS